MRFPFSISRTIRLKQTKQRVSSEGLINVIDNQLKYLDMLSKRIGDNELFLLKANVSRSLRKKDFLRNLHVDVSFRGDQILIRLQTETLLIFLAGFLPFIALFFDKPFVTASILSISVWTIGYVGKALLLNSIKRDLEFHLLINA